MRKILGYMVYICVAASVFSCRATPENGNAEERYAIVEGTEKVKETAEATGDAVKQSIENASDVRDKLEKIAEDTVEMISTEKTSATAPAYAFTPSDFPAYTGNAADKINNSIPYFTKQDLSAEAFESYSGLDELGRCGMAYANVCRDLMPTEERGEIGMVRPSGWKTAKYPGKVEGNYLYNRCHLIAYMLAGENANERNLITGTRYLNAIGMLPYEEAVADYIRHNPENHVLYRVTPVYDGDNLVADGVLMEAYSVEDNGTGICFNAYCHNVQPGILINYRDGSSKEDPDFTGEYVTESVFTEKR